ncbi:MAG: hypothetical protein AAGF11_00725 [Myxococcota bacterium]
MNSGPHRLTKAMTWTLEERVEATWVRLSGAVTGQADFETLLAQLGPGPVIVDLSGVTRLNSIGIRHWVDFATRLCRGRRVELRDCSPAFVEQLMLIEHMQGNTEIRSIQLPFSCEACDHGYDQTLAITELTELPSTTPCPRCATPSELDDLPERYVPLLHRLSKER